MATSRSPTKSPMASVIVVTHNSAGEIRDCLNALFAQDFDQGFEVIVVDNESTDSTRNILKRYPNVKVIENKNTGFGAGNNLGAQHAQGTLLAFANPDTIADPQWLKTLLGPLGPGIITTSQILLVDHPTRLNTIGLDLHFLGFSFVRGFQQPTFDARPGEVPGFSGAAFAIRKDDYARLGGFDEDIFLYGEDTELSWRAHQHQFRIIAVPASKIRHHYIAHLDQTKLYHLERSRQILLRKHLRVRDRILYAPSRLTARILVNRFAGRYGSAGRDAIRKARKEAKQFPRSNKKNSPAVRTFARRTIPFKEFQSPTVRVLGILPNALLALNAPLFRKKRRWLHAPD